MEKRSEEMILVMKNLFKKHRLAVLVAFVFLITASVYSYEHWYIPYRVAEQRKIDLKKGFVVVTTFDCPEDHPIKARLASMIYHLPGDPYYERTSASNGYCFDNANNAKQQGFRNSYNR